MVYVALLRGINVGGKSIVAMSRLKEAFERLGFGAVKTYINSGNVIFSSDLSDKPQLTEMIEAEIKREFDLNVRVTLRTAEEITELSDQIPANWTNDSEVKTDVWFLWPEVDAPKVLDQLSWDDAHETVKYFPGAIVWRADRSFVAKSMMLNVNRLPLYQQISVRNVNTLRKLHQLMGAAELA